VIVGCYTMDLYCDAADWQAPPHEFFEFPHQFHAETYGECARQARRRGWRLTRDDRAICPKCSGKKRLAPSPAQPENSR
jgi:hypothetical protein